MNCGEFIIYNFMKIKSVVLQELHVYVNVCNVFSLPSVFCKLHWLCCLKLTETYCRNTYNRK